MPPVFAAIDGREASLARRRAVSGKSALTPAGERLSNGVPSNGVATAIMSNGVPQAAAVSSGVPKLAAPISNGVSKASATASNGAPKVSAATTVPVAAIAGRAASLARRRALSAGKNALPPAAERIRDGLRNGGVPAIITNGVATAPASPTATPAAVLPTPDSFATTAWAGGSGRDLARERRAELSRRGRAEAAPSSSGPAAHAAADGAPELAQVASRDGNRVTGWQNESRVPVTGDARDTILRAGGVKVGRALTRAGLVVSGTLVRSRVHVTGDEPGATVTITGEADQRPEDDLSPRDGATARPLPQFAAQSHPHGASVLRVNLGPGGRSPERRRVIAIESTDCGLGVTGSAIGRSPRVTGDEPGSCRALTGDQYFSPERAQVECGGIAGGSGPAARDGAVRRDPVTGAKVVVAETRRGLRLSGIDVERSRRVTGGARGVDATITGSQYNAGGARACDGFARSRTVDGLAAAPITGDVPLNDAAITGTARGAEREITGTAYYRDQSSTVVAQPKRIATIDERFSVRSPLRAAQLRARETSSEPLSREQRITGTFAAGVGKVTGNLEFLFRPRLVEGENVAARLRFTGEGRPDDRVTGAAWTQHAGVTGTDGVSAGSRNPSARAGKPQSFAGVRRFATFADNGEPKHLVTGMVGFSSDAAAKVTLSGGAQG